jgi:prevent-host-death family protein
MGSLPDEAVPDEACHLWGSRYSRQYNYIVESVMEEAVSAADANRRFSLLLRGVREGRSYVVTSHGKPVARLIPAGKHDDVATSARSTLLSRLERQPVIEAGRWTRDELYEDDR